MRTSQKMFLVMGLLIAISLLLNQYYYASTDVDNFSLRPKNFSLRLKNMKNILYWSDTNPKFDFDLGTGTKLFENCTHKNCFSTYDRTVLPVEEFDALIFHGYNSHEDQMPKKRNSKQVYIYANLESPMYTHHIFDNFFNWTMNYRRDSDLFHPYGVFEKEKTHYKPPSVQEIEKRPKKIAWFVSHCNTSSERERLVAEIKKYIPVDVYGKCGDLRCPSTETEECYNMMEKQYKFYLSFENAICEDYVTEKLFNVLKKNIVPIVYGGADYKKVAPPKSVIDVLDFKISVKDLVDYIKYLDTYHEEYLNFFKWKQDYVIRTDYKRVICELCRKLNEPIKPKMYRDLRTWYYGEDHFDKCSSHFLKFIF